MFMVMEYMSGGDFGNLLKWFNALSIDHTKYYVAILVLALEGLHSRGIVHRDLKPDNLLIDRNGIIKLTDFGLSMHSVKSLQVKYGKLDPTDDTKYSDSGDVIVELPKEKWMVGTADYMAPEIINMESTGDGIDWWAVGVITFEFITGGLPFHASTW